MRVSHLQQHQSFVRDVEQRLYNMTRIQQELGTGKSLFQPSEDVVSADKALNARSQLESIAQYQRNIENGQGFVSAADGKLTSIVDLINEIDALALSVDNDHATAEDRTFAAQELNQKLESLMEYANAQFGDRYLFAGHGTLQSPFEIERDENGLITNVTAASESIEGKIYRTIDEGENVAINVTGDRIFQPTGEENTASDLFYVIRNLRDTIANDNTPPDGEEETLSTHALRANLDDIRNRIVEQQTYLGSLGQRLNNKLAELSASKIDWTDRLENAQGAEMTDLVSRLAVEEGVYNALVAIQSRVLNRSLIDYLG
ncbi:MAG: flagellar hook-associated protein FlgL [Calditrichaeota bacterium]|nr:flagellar hook-associated protein FlgL [Calditrichota bacterium]MCB9368792.1 flagellar hook-associated protein FlgL [Calditrichota bacterium]